MDLLRDMASMPKLPRTHSPPGDSEIDNDFSTLSDVASTSAGPTSATHSNIESSSSLVEQEVNSDESDSESNSFSDDDDDELQALLPDRKKKKSLLASFNKKLDEILSGKKNLAKVNDNPGNPLETAQDFKTPVDTEDLSVGPLVTDISHEKQTNVESTVAPHLIGPHIKSVKDLLQDCPCFEYDNDSFLCTYCRDYLSLDPLSQRVAFSCKYDFLLGTDFLKTPMRREFQNLKSSLKRHVTDSDMHMAALKWKFEMDKKLPLRQKASTAAGMTCGRIAYSNAYRGIASSNFTGDILLAAKNGANVGEINHGKNFPREFTKNCAEVLTAKLKFRLDTPLQATMTRPPVALSVDKMTQKKRSGQISAIGTLVPEAPPDQMVQTFFLGNPIVRNHSGLGLAESAVSELKKVLNPNSIATQLTGGGTDGQYFNLNFEEHLTEERFMLGIPPIV